GDRSFEMRLGTFWLVRIGIVMLLTGLVFFGNYAYQNYIGKIGPGGKIFLLYLSSGMLLGAGTWWQRKEAKEWLRNYAYVRMAAVFFVVRNRWAVLSFASLAASYGSYGFWRFLHGGEWAWPTPEAGLWTGTYFLIGYWVIFTTGVFLSKHEKFSGEQRASFLT